MDRAGHDAALADFGQWAFVRVPALDVLAPADAHASMAIQEIAKRHLQLDVARAEVNEVLSAIDSFETRDPIETAYNNLQSAYEDAYYYAGRRAGAVMNLDSARW